MLGPRRETSHKKLGYIPAEVKELLISNIIVDFKGILFIYMCVLISTRVGLVEAGFPKNLSTTSLVDFCSSIAILFSLIFALISSMVVLFSANLSSMSLMVVLTSSGLNCFSIKKSINDVVDPDVVFF